MSRPSRPKQPRHRYLMQKLRIIEGTKSPWERPFPKSKEYWKKFCDEEEKRLIRVREPFPKSSYLPIIPILRDFKTSLRDIVDSPAPQGLDKNVLLVDPKSSEAPDISTRGNNENVPSNAREPIVKISPPTPLKRPPKSDAVASAEEQHALFAIQNKSTIKNANSYKESLDVPSKNSITPHDGSGDGRVYSKRTCPFHRHEPAVRIFDDDIERYLTEDPRAGASPGEKLHKLPHVKDTSKYDKDKSGITSVKSKKIKRVTVPPRRELKYYPDNAIDLTASGIAEVESKDRKNDTLDKQRNFISDVHISKLEFSLGKKSTKEKKIAKGLKIVSSFPESFQPQNKVKAISDEVINKSSNSQTPEIREKLIDESE
ncbi:uncharacterized protein [Temnothorax longispinosus]|uniref:uncharacterized protein n=1 Tax=Temnothorax longispinosus TaxID=300112 RepID=UPI003A9943D9